MAPRNYLLCNVERTSRPLFTNEWENLVKVGWFDMETTFSDNGEIKKPLVSIIITSYNCGFYLAGAIESAMKQTYQHLEIARVQRGKVFIHY
jgi:hypothetical protein